MDLVFFSLKFDLFFQKKKEQMAGKTGWTYVKYDITFMISVGKNVRRKDTQCLKGSEHKQLF